MSSGTDYRRLVDKLWPYCYVLRDDDGVGVSEYTEQLLTAALAEFEAVAAALETAAAEDHP